MKFNASIFCLLLALASGVSCDLAWSGEKNEKKKKEIDEEREIREAAEEDAREASTTGLTHKPQTFKGRLMLNPIGENETVNTVVGQFETPQGTYLLKFADMQMRKDLLAENGKQISLCGKIRNEGKYFIVITAFKGGPPPAAKPLNLGGL